MADDYLNYLTATAAKIKDHASKEKANIKLTGDNQGEVGPIKFTIDRNALSTLQQKRPLTKKHRNQQQNLSIDGKQVAQSQKLSRVASLSAL